IENYFEEIDSKIEEVHGIATKARKKGYDPEEKIDIPLAKNMAERVTGLISAVAPQIVNTSVPKRINELEKKYGVLDWRISLIIALEIAQERYCKFKDKKEAMEVGIRVGFAYHTLGTVASPLEGFSHLSIERTKDGKEYFKLYFSGPIRSAGGTGASVSVLIADYVRKKMDYAPYDPTKKEIKRYVTELYDFHERVTNLQYLPSEEEIEFLAKNIPVQITGDPSEKVEVSNYKDLDRVETNNLRNGVCLVMGEGIAQKAPKLWKQLSKWGHDFEMEQWDFLGDFISLQKKIKAKGEVSKKEDKEEEKIKPDFTFIKDLVAGRPVLTHPLAAGGFRLRYGRSRTSGYSAASIHPVTMKVLNNYIATGTQLKVERPGKGCVVSPCDTIEGPIVRLVDGSVLRIDSEKELNEDNIEEILFLGDILFNYGDFLNRAHILVPPGYCEEWWVQELEKATVDMFGSLDLDKLSELVEIPVSELELLVNNPMKTKISAEGAFIISQKLGIPFHPYYTYHWKLINFNQLISLVEMIKTATIKKEGNEIKKIIIPLKEEGKRVLELIGISHLVVNKEFAVIEKQAAMALAIQLGFYEKKINSEIEEKKNVLDIINLISLVKIRDKSGIFIGARMGRPEKAKLRKLTGSPQVLFPVGKEGGRMRSFQEAFESGIVRADFPIYYCDECNKKTIFSVCEKCDKKTRQLFECNVCGVVEKNVCPKHGNVKSFNTRDIDIKYYFDCILKKLGTKTFPDLIKGVRGTSNKDHIPEHLIKGVLRSKYDLYVNKDGTIRYDMTQMPITHFKPKEINTSVEKLKELGYIKDIHNKPLENKEQVLEIKPQDIILSACMDSPEKGADKILFKVAQFCDELLVKLYGLKPFYNLESVDDLIGHICLALAPHTSAAIATRIIGFSQTQGFLAHPLVHAATRRDCFVYDSKIVVYDKKQKRVSQVEIGKFVEEFNPYKKADNYGTLVKEIDNYYTYSLNKKLELSRINEVSIHTPTEIAELILEDGRVLKLTLNHEVFVKGLLKKKAIQLEKGDQLMIPYKFDIMEKDVSILNLFDILKESKGLMVRNVVKEVNNLVREAGGRKKFREVYNLKKRELDNYLLRDSFPAGLFLRLKIKPNEIGFNRDKISIKSEIILENDFFYLLGLYVAEGFARKKETGKGYYQISIAVTEKEIRDDIIRIMKKYFNLSPSENHIDHVTFSSRIVYELFVDYFKLGGKAYEKNIDFFLDLKKEKLASILKGYLDGDGSVSEGELRVTFDTVSQDLIDNLRFIFSRFGIYISSRTYKKQPGPKVRGFYLEKGRRIPEFEITKLKISSKFVLKFNSLIGFKLKRKQEILDKILRKIKPKYNKIEFDNQFAYPKIIDIKHSKQKTYCLNVEGNHNFICNDFLVKNCDGDEACVMLLMDAFLNFSMRYLPAHKGSTQDAPLVMTSHLIPSEVDDMIFDMDISWRYPLEFYNACLEYKNPWDVEIDKVGDFLAKPKQYEKHGFTHDISNINMGVRCSAYKTLPSMEDKLKGQMEIAERIRAVDTSDVARLVIEKHFIRDTKGNLRKFSMQQFRCVKCNEKFRRPPLIGKCAKCGGRIIFTIAEGSVVKYLEPSISLAKKYNVPAYLKQSLELLQRRIEDVFGKEKEKQTGLGAWFG
ncbi:DNA polymerase II large subunit, partial [Candidatus Woesearchaeota archaeon]|nr:DNA polymerase II large subunit [Candidatus Woesearchaeota archaeon]